MGSSLKKYAFINAKLRAGISKILPDDLINQMIRAHSFSESIQLLRETPFAVVETVYNKTGDSSWVCSSAAQPDGLFQDKLKKNQTSIKHYNRRR